jgi:hypothetical protein
MTVYEVSYYTLGRGKDPKGEVGNIEQWRDTAYIFCKDISDTQGLLEEHFQEPNKNGSYYFPVITKIQGKKGCCITQLTP